MIRRLVVVLAVVAVSGWIIVETTTHTRVSAGRGASSSPSVAAPSSTSSSVPSLPPSAPSTSPALPGPSATRAQLSAWFARVHVDFAAFGSDERNLAKASGKAADITALKGVCRTLKADVATFKADPAAPDATLRNDLAHAMTDYLAAANDCLQGAYGATGKTSIAGTEWLARAALRIEHFGR